MTMSIKSVKCMVAVAFCDCPWRRLWTKSNYQLCAAWWSYAGWHCIVQRSTTWKCPRVVRLTEGSPSVQSNTLC